MTEQLNEMKRLAGLKSKVNEGVEDIVRKLGDLAAKQKSDENANMLSRVADALQDYGQPFGPKNLADVAQRAGLDPKVVKKAIEYAQRN